MTGINRLEKKCPLCDCDFGKIIEHVCNPCFRLVEVSKSLRKYGVKYMVQWQYHTEGYNPVTYNLRKRLKKKEAKIACDIVSAVLAYRYNAQ